MPKSEETQAQLRYPALELYIETNSPCEFQAVLLYPSKFISEVRVIAAILTCGTVSFAIKYLLSIHMHDTKLERYSLNQKDAVPSFKEFSCCKR